ncbi:integral membrane protein [Cryptococcus deuterogattii 99/473]|uniref:Integral membrane protein n=1 Tax=Cryptococcus deuterogattii Ram5 TaxID=1296110 RepID=A0A0D0U647_9TREE|nr:integral membrane protein [Cryptococcus deuterogattii Ram5]KIR97977.1 integral membrane protein [Cryptococcus deuterogattii 2001/935-1]KIY60505.1 integral membrane protein [Cryptococcus deuterogattii 99/473]
MTQSAFLKAFILSSFVSSVYAFGEDRDCPADPYADPANDICNPLRYVPNKVLNCLGAALFFIVAAALTFFIGAWFEGVGFVLRVLMRDNLHSLNLYIVANLFIILAPCAFLAGDYIVFGRLVQFLEANHHIRPFKARQISRIFIASDISVITFLIQGSGGGLSASSSTGSAELGAHLFLAGIAIQMVSFIFFSCVWITFGIRVFSGDKQLWHREGWKPLYFALGFTCICFIIRSIYRTAELAGGYISYLSTHEGYFLGLDSLPLLLGIATYVFFWPGNYLHFDGNPFKKSKARGIEEGAQMYPLKAGGSYETQTGLDTKITPTYTNYYERR